MELALGIVLTGITAWFIVRPHLGAPARDPASVESTGEALFDQKSRCLQVLKDLELDFSTGKVGSEDYKATRNTLSLELAQILKRLGE